jgi:hypothetical protein
MRFIQDIWSRRYTAILPLAGLLLVSALFAQPLLPVNQYKGDRINRAKNTMSGNQVQSTFYNYGLVGNIGEISGEWPIGTGNYYVGDVSPLVGVEFVHPSGDTLHSVVTSDGPRGASDGPSSGGTFWGFEALYGFNAPPAVGQVSKVALSNQPDTWPAQWPDKAVTDLKDPLWTTDAMDPGWAGKWNGYFGKNVFNADQETYFQMDDDADGEWFLRNRTDNPDTNCIWTPMPTAIGAPFTITYSAYRDTSLRNAEQVYIDWGINEGNHGNWTVPPQNLWPEGSVAIDGGVRSPMQTPGSGLWQATMPGDPSIYSMHWRFTDGGVHVHRNRGLNWNNFYGQTRSFYYYPSSYDSTMRGMGLRVAVRGLQWSHFLAQDCIFWLYDITNISTHTYDKVCFGMVVGTLAGGRCDQATHAGLSWFDQANNITYSWAANDAHCSGWVPVSADHYVGYCGYAFLESPGNPYDGIDNDGDDTLRPGLIYPPTAPMLTPSILETMLASKSFQPGDSLVLIDYETYQRRDTTFPASGSLVYYIRDARKELAAGQLVREDSTNGIDDNFNGLIDEHVGQVNRKYIDYVNHLGLDDEMIDEARDDGIDNNHNWSALTDDLGADGLPGSGDTGEGDGRPTDGEPNFDRTDVNESDQIGLTAFDYFTPPSGLLMNNDPNLWAHLIPGHYSSLADVPPEGEDGDFIYGSGYFPLRPGQTERFSMALLFGEDLPDITQNKITVQQIYDENYNFARPPDKPTLWAVPGNGKVTLYWDDVAERSFDRVCSCNDFEGYKIYRATDPAFQEVFTVTDGQGRKVFHKPIAQFDLKNNLSGFFPVIRNSVIFFLGNDTGLQNAWTDTTVENGETYYYAVCAYDHGDLVKQILPAENTKTISVSSGGDVTLDINTAMVTPRAPAAGYQAPEFTPIRHVSGNATGAIAVEVVDPRRIDSTQTYDFAFKDVIDTINHVDANYCVIRRGEASSDTIINWTPLIVEDNLLPQAARFAAYYDSLFNLRPGTYYPQQYFRVAGTDIFDGQRAYILSPRQTSVIPQFTGWADTSRHVLAATFSITHLASPDGAVLLDGVANSADYQIEWYPDNVDTTVGINYYNYIVLPPTPVNFKVKNLNTGQYIRTSFQERDTTRNGRVDNSEIIVFREYVSSLPDSLAITWAAFFQRSYAENDTLNPAAGDLLRLALYQKFASADRFEYSVLPAKVVPAGVNLDAIRVYPNPYLAVSNQEPRNIYAEGRGERRITFTHLPNTCTIRIYTVRGELVQTLNHAVSIDDGAENWDLRSKDGLNIAYGIYIYHIESPYGEKIGRFAVIK